MIGAAQGGTDQGSSLLGHPRHVLVGQVLWSDLASEDFSVPPELEEGTFHIPCLELDLTDLTRVECTGELRALPTNFEHDSLPEMHTYLVATEPSHHLELQQAV